MGRSKHYSIELTSINMMQRAGWRSNMIKAGDQIKAIVAPLLSGEPVGLGLEVTFADGSVRGSRCPPRAASSALPRRSEVIMSAPHITWLLSSFGRGCFCAHAGGARGAGTAGRSGAGHHWLVGAAMAAGLGRAGRRAGDPTIPPRRLPAAAQAAYQKEWQARVRRRARPTRRVSRSPPTAPTACPTACRR